MIAYVKGMLAASYPGQVIIETQGIGYRVFVPASLNEKLPAAGNEVKIYTYMHVKEDDLKLYGFGSLEEKEVFELLLMVNGIGPKGALGILSSMSCDELRYAVLSSDSKKIAKAPGVGAKTAQKIILELKDKMKLEDVFEPAGKSESGQIPLADTGRNDAILALCALGYSDSEALRAVSAVKNAEALNSDQLLKAALKNLM